MVYTHGTLDTINHNGYYAEVIHPDDIGKEYPRTITRKIHSDGKEYVIVNNKKYRLK